MRTQHYFFAILIFWGCTQSGVQHEKSSETTGKKDSAQTNIEEAQDTIPQNQTQTSMEPEYSPTEGVEIPALKKGERVIRHLAYTLSYSEEHEQARWVAYELTAEETTRRYERSDRFEPDPWVVTGTADHVDYKGSGYDRGHLAPAADMSWSQKAMQESFYYSNMSPQEPGFNRGIWKRLEEQVRDWALELGRVCVVTGPVLQKGLPRIGVHGVAIPQYYYKVILAKNGSSTMAIGFIMPNIGSRLKIQNFAVSVDEVEKRTGIDFFPLLDDKLENRIESTLCTDCWVWNAYRTANGKVTKGTQKSIQCSGITQKGLRCKRRTKDSSGRCYQHQ